MERRYYHSEIVLVLTKVHPPLTGTALSTWTIPKPLVAMPCPSELGAERCNWHLFIFFFQSIYNPGSTSIWKTPLSLASTQHPTIGSACRRKIPLPCWKTNGIKEMASREKQLTFFRVLFAVLLLCFLFTCFFSLPVMLLVLVYPGTQKSARVSGSSQWIGATS